MDLDGYLDVIVSRHTLNDNTSSNRGVVYIWNPRTGAVMNTNAIKDLCVYVNAGYYGPGGPSIPFVGDIDGDGKPEIVVISKSNTNNSKGENVGVITAYDFENGQLDLKWNQTNNDYSASTGITLFDFNQDGAGELVYRDITHLRILRGSDGRDTITPVACYSPTGIEYPIVVDYNNDGSAEILVTGGQMLLDPSEYSPTIGGVIQAYGSSGTKWAPARKVWNQYMYNVVNINDDLTVPRYQRNPATVFPNGTRPYNNFLQQQTSLDVAGNRIWLLPDLALTGGTLTVSGGTATVKLNITNQGDASIGPPIYVSFYRNAISLDNHFRTVSVDSRIDPGNMIQKSFEFPDEVALNIVARVNDSVHVASGGAKTWVFPVRPECDDYDPEYLNNAYMIPNPYSSGFMKKDSRLLPVDGSPFDHNGFPGNPVAVFYGDTVEYTITAVNPVEGDLVVRDTLPAFMVYGRTMSVPASATYTVEPPLIVPFGSSQALSWKLKNVARTNYGSVTFRASPELGANASQPLYVNRAWVGVPNGAGDTIYVPTGNATYHQGAGASTVTFSASSGGSIYNADRQVVDYRTPAAAGVLAAPDEGYRFAGWSHGAYVSPRGAFIPPAAGIERYDTLAIYGNVELRARFEPYLYPIRYMLHGGANAAANPPSYTVEDAAITLAPPVKAGDVFIGWTGSCGDAPQAAPTIPSGSTGERTYYANYLYSGRESSPVDGVDRVWASGGELYVHTSHAGVTVRVYTPDGLLHRLFAIPAAGLTKRPLLPGVYIVTLNSGEGHKVIITSRE
jgi:uncharacterized repeat protein (TIGR02543 family)